MNSPQPTASMVCLSCTMFGKPSIFGKYALQSKGSSVICPSAVRGPFSVCRKKSTSGWEVLWGGIGKRDNNTAKLTTSSSSYPTGPHPLLIGKGVKCKITSEGLWTLTFDFYALESCIMNLIVYWDGQLLILIFTKRDKLHENIIRCDGYPLSTNNLFPY